MGAFLGQLSNVMARMEVELRNGPQVKGFSFGISCNKSSLDTFK
jgi:hypothetical protein